MTVTIYGAPMTRAGRCLWAAEELHLDYKHVSLNMMAGEHKAPAYLAINPNGKSPGMTDGDFKLFESLAINQYLASQYGKGGLQPDDAQGQALAAQWSLWVATECETPLLHAILHTFGMFGFEKSKDKVNNQRKLLEPKLVVLDGALQGRDYLAGSRFTVADLNVASVFQWGQTAGMDWMPHKNVAAWLDRCLNRPANQKVGAMVAAAMAKPKA